MTQNTVLVPTSKHSWWDWPHSSMIPWTSLGDPCNPSYHIPKLTWELLRIMPAAILLERTHLKKFCRRKIIRKIELECGQYCSVGLRTWLACKRLMCVFVDICAKNVEKRKLYRISWLLWSNHKVHGRKQHGVKAYRLRMTWQITSDSEAGRKRNSGSWAARKD